MKEFIEKLIGRLEEISVENTCSDCPYKAKCDEVQEHINDETTDLCGATIKALSIEIVNQLAEEYKGGWIPVSERFPDTDEYILLSFSNFSVPLVGRWEEDEDGGAFYVGDETETCVSQDIFVNAWQPLPAVYQPKGE